MRMIEFFPEFSSTSATRFKRRRQNGGMSLSRPTKCAQSPPASTRPVLFPFQFSAPQRLNRSNLQLQLCLHSLPAHSPLPARLNRPCRSSQLAPFSFLSTPHPSSAVSCPRFSFVSSTAQLWPFSFQLLAFSC